MHRYLGSSERLKAGRGEYLYHKGRRHSPRITAFPVMLVLSLLTRHENAHKLSHKRRRSDRGSLLNERSKVTRGVARRVI